MEDFPSNSLNKKQSPHEKKLKQIVTDTAIMKKKSELRKLVDVFISDDIVNVKSYVFLDVIVPTVKKAITDVVAIVLYGGKARKGSGSETRFSYQSYYNDSQNRTSYGAAYQNRPFDNLDDIVIEDRGKAEEALIYLEEAVDMYGSVSVADYYDVVGIKDHNYTNNKYGWDNLTSAKIIRVRGGWMIKLPRVIPLS